MNFSRFLVAAAAALLLGGIALAAPGAKQTASTKTSTATMKTTVHHESGVINSMTSSDLTLSHTYKGKTESLSFKLDPNTKKIGAIDKGARVVVYYKNENGEHLATEVKARKA